MSQRISDLNALIEYFTRIMDCKECAPKIAAIPLALLGAVLWRKDADAPINVRTYGAYTGRMLWVQINGQRYTFTHNRSPHRIELHRGKNDDEVIAEFTNDTPVTEVRRLFETL